MVATVTVLKSSANAVSYFEKDGYYAKDDPEHRDASFWHGAAARDAGLKAHVLPHEFEDVLDGWVPGTEIRLGRLREGEHDHRPGWDITFSAPKSVSLEGLVMGDRRVIRAHDDAVRATLDWIEADLLQTRGWDPITWQRPRVAADGMIVAGFRHLASRTGDPQLHTHCVLANMTRNASGEWRSVEPTAIRRSEKLIGAYYRNELAMRLQAMEMAVTPRMIGTVPGFELAGYDKSFLDAFSGRRRDILAYLEKHDLPYTAELAQMAALATRPPKRETGLSELVPGWRAKARALGLSRDKAVLRPARPVDPATGKQVPPVEVPPPDLPANELRSLRRAPKLPPLPRDPGLAALGKTHAPMASTAAPLSPAPETGVLEAVARAVDHVTERRSTVSEAEIRAVALGHAPGRYALADVDRAVSRLVGDGKLIVVERRGVDRAFVTDAAVRSERKILAYLRAGRGAGKALCDRDTVEERLSESRLTEGQREAVRTVLLSGDRIVGVQGHAGSGKTTMLREAKALMGARRIVGLAPSAAAARVLEKEAGIAARTLQYFLARYGNLSPDRLTKAREEYAGAVLAVDECSMIDTVRMRELLRIADLLGVARVALVGDTAQLRAVDAGEPFKLLQKAGMATATMGEVLRQKDKELLRAVMHARHGEAGEAMGLLGGERVREVPREQLGTEAARRWLALEPEDRADTAVMAPTHEIRRQANAAIREGLEEDGTLRGKVLSVDRLVPRRLTRALAADIASYEPGDTLVFHRDVFGCAKDDVCIVTATGDGRVVLLHPDGGERSFRPSGNAAWYFGLYDTERIELRAGERIRWTRNRKARPPRFGHPPIPELVNGGEAEIVEIGSRRVRFRDGEREFTLALDDAQLRHLDHAYCTTVHAAQGKTANAAIAVLDAGGAADREMFHVEISRVRREFLLLTDDREALIELIEERGGRGDGALESLGIDPGSGSGTSPSISPPTVEPEIIAGLAADWRALKEKAEETDTPAFFLPGYREIVARAAALGTGDLEPEMRGFVDGMLEEHRRHLARDRGIAALVGRIQAHWRRWPEIAWADSAPDAAAWREEAEALIGEGNGRLAETGDGNDTARHLSAMPGGRDGLAAALGGLERTRLLDDARRFEAVWGEHRERARREDLPESLLPGYREIAELGHRLDGKRLDGDLANAVAEWRAVDAEQAALADAVRTLPERVAAWRDSRADTPEGETAADLAVTDRAAWRKDGERLESEARAMLRPDDAHAPYVAAAPGASANLEAALGAVRDTLADHRFAAFNRLAEDLIARHGETGIAAFHQPGFGALVAEARALDRLPGLSDAEREALGTWLDYDADGARLCREIAAWPDRADAQRNLCPSSGAGLEELSVWREEAAPLLAEARAMTADDSAHKPHLDAMAEQRGAVEDAARRLDAAVAAVEWVETTRLMKSAADFAREKGGIPYDAPEHGPLVERARSLDARTGLPQDRREIVGTVLAADERWADERKRAGAFLDAAREAGAGRTPDGAGTLGDIARPDLSAHLIALGAGPDEVAEREEQIRGAAERDQRARAEAARQEADRARIAEQARLAAERAAAEREAKARAERDARASREKEAGAEKAASDRAAAGKREAETAAAQARTPARGRENVREAAPDRGTGRDREAAQRPSRGERQAARLAQRLDASLARRDALLERAKTKLPYLEPVTNLGLSHKLWRRDADRAIEAGRKLLDDPRHAPQLDALGGREKIEAGVRRLEQARSLDALPARMAAGMEEIRDRERETGRHRFFLPEHQQLCVSMSVNAWDLRTSRASGLIRDELNMREEMTRQAERLDRVAETLKESLEKRAAAEKSAVPFVRQEDYRNWVNPARRAVNEAEAMLRDRGYGVQFENRPGLKDTLRDLADRLDRPLRAERDEWQEIERQRIATEHQQSQTRGRGMSW